jgi:WXXGXW repeat (2 copies)
MAWQSLFRTGAASVLLTASLALTGACVTPAGRLYVRIAPPAPVYEMRRTAPGPGYVWIDGYYRWDGSTYLWRPGRWERPPRPRAVWVPGRWRQDRHGWYWTDGHWR